MTQIVYTKKAAQKLVEIVTPVDQENCAFLVGGRDGDTITITDVIPTPNLARNPGGRYFIGRLAWIKALKHHPIIGSAHTHPGGPTIPTPGDLRGVREGQIGAIVHPRTASLVFYTATGEVQRKQLVFPAWLRVLVFLLCD